MISTPMMWWKAAQGSLESLMHFNENPGKQKQRGVWEGSGDGSPALWQLIRSPVFIIPCNSPSLFFGVNLPPFLYISSPISSRFKWPRRPQKKEKANINQITLVPFLPASTCFSFPSATWLLISFGRDDAFLFIVIFIPGPNVACQVGSSCLELSVALGRINDPAAIIWLYKDKSHTLSLTLQVFLKHVWTDRHTHTHTHTQTHMFCYKCSAMPPMLHNDWQWVSENAPGLC